MTTKGFKADHLDDATKSLLEERALRARGDILAMTTLAASGHPGGSLSSIDIYTTLLTCARIYPDDPANPDRDRIVISHGHTSPGAYPALAQANFFTVEEAVTEFRLCGTRFEGHVERTVPGIEWGTGNLGQGLSVGCGFALSSRIHGRHNNIFVVMGDGEQQKGQIAEARRFAVKYGLHTITAIIDCNHLQISGKTADIMPQNIKDNFASDGWSILEIDGHDFDQIYDALHTAVTSSSRCVAIIAQTTMGKGVSFIENKAKYHGVPLNIDQFEDAMQELGVKIDIDHYRNVRSGTSFIKPEPVSVPQNQQPSSMNFGEPLLYSSDTKTDNRSAFGNALRSIAEAHAVMKNPPIAVLDCDLAGSVKTTGFQEVLPDNFFQCGIQEHSTATMAGALSIDGVTTYFADFGVFGVCEAYNQQRLNDINHAGIKLICTHIGLDVGEDGKTHQCIDYISLLNNLFTFKIIIPADPNQTDRATRYISATPGNFFLGMGRSKLPVITDDSGNPFYDTERVFQYGAIDMLRQGDDATILTCGSMVHRALTAHDILKNKSIYVRILNVACPKCIDIDVIADACRTGLLVTYEDHNRDTGLGSIIANALIENGLSPRFKKMGVSAYGESGSPDDLFKSQGLTPESLAAAVEQELQTIS